MTKLVLIALWRTVKFFLTLFGVIGVIAGTLLGTIYFFGTIGYLILALSCLIVVPGIFLFQDELRKLKNERNIK